ncbi:MAG: PH domain-containing protein [Acidobacteriota bacterium]|nr:PH domain-containing protein [Acidobacteriota bacterium]
MGDREQTGDSNRSEENEAAKPAPVVPSLVDGAEHLVDPRTVRVARIIGFSVVLPLSMAPLILSTIGWAVGGIPGPAYLAILGVWLLLLASFLLWAYRWPAVRHRHLRYLVEEEGLCIRRGVIWRKVIWIPITRVQHTDVSQGPVQRRFDLGTLTVHTAGTAGASISLAGLEHGIATRLSDHLRPALATDAD